MRLVYVMALIFLGDICYGQNAPGAEDVKMPKALIKLSPLQLFSNTLELGIETFNSNYSKSFQGTVGFRSGSNEFDKGKGLSADVAFRKYVLPMELRSRKGRDFYQGIYYSVFLAGSYFEAEQTSTWWDVNGTPTTTGFTVEIKSISPGFTIGLQKTIWKVLTLDAFIGGGIKFSESHYSGTNYTPYYQGIWDPGYDGIYPKFGAKIGVGL